MKQYKTILRAAVALTALCITWAVVTQRSNSATATMGPPTTDKPAKLVVLMYHSVNSNPNRAGDYVITPDALQRDLDYLQQEGYNSIVMSELIDFVHNGTPLPPRPVMLTFDDGYYNNYLHAFPLLQKYNTKAVVSIIGTETDKFSALDENNQNYSHLTWQQIQEMQQSGLVEFQNHGYNMHKSAGKRIGSTRNQGEGTEEYQRVLEEDMVQLQERYTEMTGWTPNTYTYPFGRISKESYPVVTKVGFAASLDVQARVYVATPGDERCLFRIPRFNRTCETSAEAILKKVKKDLAD